MSATLSTIVQPAGTKGPGAYFPTFKAFWEGIQRYLARRAAIESLREFDDHALQDIGLARSQIEAAVRGLRNAPSRAGS